MKVDPKTAHRIAAGEITAVLRTRELVRAREPVQFERLRGEEDRAPRHADDTTVLDTKCHVAVTGQGVVTLGALTDRDAKRLGHRSLFMFRQAVDDLHERGQGPAWQDDCEMVMVTFALTTDERPLFLARVTGYTESRHMAIDDEVEAVPPGEVKRINDRRRQLIGLWQRERQILTGSLGRLTADTETRLACAREIRALQRQLDALDRKLQSAA